MTAPKVAPLYVEHPAAREAREDGAVYRLTVSQMDELRRDITEVLAHSSYLDRDAGDDIRSWLADAARVLSAVENGGPIGGGR